MEVCVFPCKWLYESLQSVSVQKWLYHMQNEVAVTGQYVLHTS